MEMKEITTKSGLEQYLKEKAESHNYYKHYGKKADIDKICKGHAIYLLSPRNWNDRLEAENFPDDGHAYFAFCLSFSQSENVAMWMLYSRNDGAMIDFGKQIIGCIDNNKPIEIGHFANHEFVSDKTLNIGQFDIFISDVIYYGETKNGNSEKYYVKRSDEVVQEFPKEVIDSLKMVKKRTPWSYENECRIIVSVDKSVIDWNKVAPEQLCVKIKLDRCDLTGRVYNSPNAGNNGSSEYLPSKLTDKINWDLCNNCKFIRKSLNK